MKFKFINQMDPYYQDAKMLRWEVLEKPHGIPPDFRPMMDERNCWHLIALEKNKLVGCAVFRPLSETEGKIFDCVFENPKGGFGRKMIHELEERLLKRGVASVHVIVQRENEGFFSLLGYIKAGESFEEYGIAYQRMDKTLAISA